MFQRYAEIQRRKSLGMDEGGFTLIELLMSSSFSVFSRGRRLRLGGVTGQSAKSACNSDAKTVETAYAAYQAQGGAALTNSTPTTAAAAQQAVASAVSQPSFRHTSTRGRAARTTRCLQTRPLPGRDLP